jgi:putative Mn2+ efflux pump MntP
MVNDRDEVITIGDLMYVPAFIISFFAFLFGMVATVDLQPTLTSIIAFVGGILGCALSLKELYNRHCL